MQKRRPTTSATATRCARAFTLVELVCGLIITVIVVGAVATFAMAVGASWRSGETGQAIAVSSAQATIRLQHQLQGACALGACVTGSSDGSDSNKASVLFWKSDYNGDGLIQTSELALIVHEDDALNLYECNPAQRTTMDAQTPYSSGQISNSGAGAWFKGLTHVVHQPLTGTASTSGLASNSRLRVVGAKFMKYQPTGQRPLLEYTLNLSRGSVTDLQYGMIALRSATTAGN